MGARRIGIYTRRDRTRGLWRDAEALAWAIEGRPVRLPGEPQLKADIFAVERYGDDVSEEGLDLKDWFARIETMIVVENLTMTTGIFTAAKTAGVRTVFVPNLDWACIGGRLDSRGFVAAVNGLVTKPGVPAIDQVWAKTEKTFERLLDVQVDAARLRLVPWSIPDPVVTGRCTTPTRVTRFYMNAGYHGWRNRRGVDIAIRAFETVRARHGGDVELHIHTLKGPTVVCPGAGPTVACPGVVWLYGERSRAALQADLLMVDVVLFPSRWEGFGIPLLEALHAGTPVIAPAGWPMNELFTDRVHGLQVGAERVGRMRLAEHYEMASSDLANAMLELLDTDRRAELTDAEPGYYIARQHAFGFRVRAYAAGEDTPEVLVVRSPGKGADEIRSERYWESTLSDFGFDVKSIPHDQPGVITDALHDAPRFVLVGKTPPHVIQAVQEATEAPVLLYHHDLMQAAEAWMRWFDQAAPLVDFAFVPETAENYHNKPYRRKVVRLLPGPRVAPPGSKLGRRFPPQPEDARHPFILHQTTYKSPERERVLSALADARLTVRVQGTRTRNAFGPNIKCVESVWGWAARVEAKRAEILLSVSLKNGVPGYTSNRLVNAGAVGACVLAIAYPGHLDDYDESCVCWTSLDNVVSAAKMLLRNALLREEMRRAITQATWQRHSWHRRFETMLRVLSVRDARAHRSDFDMDLHLGLGSTQGVRK